MSVNFKCGDCPAYLAAMEFDEESNEWKDFTNMRHCLMMVLVSVQFPKGPSWAITKQNWEEVFIRVHMWEQVIGALRLGFEQVDSDDNGKPPLEKISIYFTPDEIESMIGFQVNAGAQTDKQYDSHLGTVLRRNAQTELRRVQHDQFGF